MRNIFLLVLSVLVNLPGFAQFPESFEGNTFPPAGWRIFDNGIGTSQSWQRTNVAYMGQNAAFIRWENVPQGLAEDWLVTPRFTPTNEAHMLSFFQKDNYAIDYASVYTVRVSDASATNTEDFVIVNQQNEPDLGLRYRYHEVDLSSYIGKQIYVAFVMTNDDGDDWVIDEVHLAPCSRPENLRAENITSTGAVIRWDDDSANAWDIEIVESGQIPSGIPTASGISNPFVWNGGKALSHYDVYLKAKCTSNSFSNYSGPFSFYTSCGTNSCDYKFVLADTYGDDWNGAYIEVRQGGVSLGQITQHTAGFGPFEYYLSLCDSLEFELIWHAGNWDVECIFSFRDIYDQEYFSFSAGEFPENNALFYKGIADCSPVTCRFPTNLKATGYTENGARIHWQEKDDANRWDLEFVASGDDPTGLPTVENVAENPFIWTGGNPGTYYHAYVRSVCGDNDQSKWSLPAVFATRCVDVISSFPFKESFTTDYLLPSCWISESENGGTHFWRTTIDTYSGDTIVFCAHANTNQDVWLIAPGLGFTGLTESISLSFNWKMSYYWMVYPYDKANLNVKVSTDKGKTWSKTLWSESDPGFFESFEWQDAVIDLSEFAGFDTVWVGFQYTGKDAASVYLDNFIIDDGSGGISSVNEITINTFIMYPSPTPDRLNVNFLAEQDMNGQIKILDLHGKTLKIKNVETRNGTNRYMMDLIDLQPGIYLLSLELPQRHFRKKFVKI